MPGAGSMSRAAMPPSTSARVTRDMDADDSCRWSPRWPRVAGPWTSRCRVTAISRSESPGTAARGTDVAVTGTGYGSDLASDPPTGLVSSRQKLSRYGSNDAISYRDVAHAMRPPGRPEGWRSIG